MNKIVTSIILVMLFVVGIATAKMPYENFGDIKTIRVGYVVSDSFQGGGEGKPKEGYGYEYLQTLANYAGWHYEYVYGSFSDNLKRLQNGEIDIMGNLSYTDERAKVINFSNNEQGRESYYIFAREHDTTITSDIKSFAGKKIGVNKGAFQNTMLIDMCKSKGVTCELVEYTSPKERIADLLSGKIDATLTTLYMNKTPRNMRMVRKLGEAPYYFGVAKQRPDVLKELNDAQDKILADNIHYNEEVYGKYSTKLSTIGEDLPDHLKEWGKNHGPIVVGYKNGYEPYAVNKSGDFSGVYKDLLDNMKDIYHVPYRAKAFESKEDLLKALHNGEIDAIAPICDDMWLAEADDVALTIPVIDDHICVVYNNEYDSINLGRVAVYEGNMVQDAYLQLYYPDAQKIVYKNIYDCLKAVRNGEADVTLYLNACMDFDMQQKPELFDGLNIAKLRKNVELAFGVRRGNPEILSILNHGIYATDATFMENSRIANAQVNHNLTLQNFLRHNAGLVTVILIFVVLIIIITFVTFAVNQKKHQRMLEQARQNANKANVAKTDFLNHMSHDIRTPIHAIKGMIEIIKDNKDDAPYVINCVEKIDMAADHLLSLVNDVLDMSKLESGKIVLDNKTFDLMRLLGELEAICSSQANNNDLKFTMDLVGLDKPQYFVKGSPLHITRIMMNLFSNALKYNKPCGSIRMWCHVLEYKDDKVDFEFGVSDTGVGMSEDYVKNKLFVPFSQEKNNARTKYQGTGLGMAIVKELIEKMSGNLQVTSKVDQGTTFKFQLSLEKVEDDIVVPVIQAKSQNIKGMNVLLTDDNDINLEIAQYVLEENGATVDMAHDGQEALDKFQNNAPNTYDLIIMDIMMPVMDGLEATKAIRALGDARPDALTIPIISMTANAFTEDEKKVHEAGMNAHLTKPIVKKEFLETLAAFNKNN